MVTTKATQLRQEVSDLRKVVWTLIAWMSQSANSPIRPDEAQELLRRLAKGYADE